MVNSTTMNWLKSSQVSYFFKFVIFIQKYNYNIILIGLYEFNGIPENQRQGDNSIKSKVDQIMKRLDKNEDHFVSLEEFVEGCNDESVKKLLIDPLVN